MNVENVKKFAKRPMTAKEETFRDKVFFWKGVPVCLTVQLAEFYGTSADVITRNFNRNKDRFKVGDHFFRLSGRQVVDFARKSHLDFSENTTVLTLWTKRGAVRHAKILTTDKAWDVWEVLEKEYFEKNTKSESERLNDAMTPDMLARQRSIPHQKDNSITINSENVFSEENTVLGRQRAMQYNQRNCLAISGRTPLSWREEGIALGFPQEVTCSAKAVARRTQPEIACARSLADRLVLDGINEDAAFEVGRAFVHPFRLLIDTGWTFRQVNLNT